MEMKQSGWWCLKDKVAPRLPEATLDGRKRRGQTAVIEIDPSLLGSEAQLGIEVAEGGKNSPRTPKRPRIAASPPKGTPVKADLVPAIESPLKRSLPAIAPQPPPPLQPLLQSTKQALVQPTLQSSVQPPLLHTQHTHTVQTQPANRLATLGSNPPAVLTAEQQAKKNQMAANEIKRKLVERLLRVDSSILKAALSKETDDTHKPLNPIMYIPPAMKAKQAGDEHVEAKKEKKRLPRPANYVRASPHENELVDICNKIVDPDERICRLKRKLAVRRVNPSSSIVINIGSISG